MQHVTDALRPYWPLIAAVILWPIITGVLNWWLWWDTAEHWDAFVARQPRAAFAVRLLRAAGPHLRKFVVAWRDYAASRSALPLSPTPAVPADAVRLTARTTAAQLTGEVVLQSPAPLADVAEKAGAVAVFDTRASIAPPPPAAPTPLRAVTLTGVVAVAPVVDQETFEIARNDVARSGLFDPTRTQDVTHAAQTARAILDPPVVANDREGEP